MRWNTRDRAKYFVLVFVLYVLLNLAIVSIYGFDIIKSILL